MIVSSSISRQPVRWNEVFNYPRYKDFRFTCKRVTRNLFNDGCLRLNTALSFKDSLETAWNGCLGHPLQKKHLMLSIELLRALSEGDIDIAKIRESKAEDPTADKETILVMKKGNNHYLAEIKSNRILGSYPAFTIKFFDDKYNRLKPSFSMNIKYDGDSIVPIQQVTLTLGRNLLPSQSRQREYRFTTTICVINHKVVYT